DDDEEDDGSVSEDSDQSRRDTSLEFVSTQTFFYAVRDGRFIDERGFHRVEEPFLDFNGSPMAVRKVEHRQSSTQGQKSTADRRGFSRYNKAWCQARARHKAGSSSIVAENSHWQAYSFYSQPQHDFHNREV